MFNENTWKDGESRVQKHMKKLGYKILYTNFKCAGVELDIVSIYPKKLKIKKIKEFYKLKIKGAKTKKEKLYYLDQLKIHTAEVTDSLVVTEVKARATGEFGKGYEAVTKAKQSHIIRGLNYLMSLQKFKELEPRCDIASVDAGEITYIENAF